MVDLYRPLLSLLQDGIAGEGVNDIQLPNELVDFLQRQSDVNFPMVIYQEAKFTRNGVCHQTLRACPSYRSGRSWYDWVMVSYIDGNEDRVFYPFQVHGFFQNSEKNSMAFRRMGQRNKGSSSPLLDQWSLENQYRIVDMETMSHTVFVLSIPNTCYRDGGSRRGPNEVFVFKDRIVEWPTIFAHHPWTKRNKKAKKRKRNAGA